MRGNSHVRFGERGGETRQPQGWKVRPAPTLRLSPWRMKYFMASNLPFASLFLCGGQIGSQPRGPHC